MLHLSRGRKLLGGERGCLSHTVELGNQMLDQAVEESKFPHKLVRLIFMNLTPSRSIDPAQNLLSTAGKIRM